MIRNKLGTGVGLSAFGGFVTFMLAKSNGAEGATLALVVVMGPLLLAIGLGLILWHVAPTLVEKRFGAPEIAVDPQRARIGDELTIVVRLVPKRDVVVSLVKISLFAEERVDQDDSDTIVTVLDEQEREVMGRALAAGEEATFGAKFTIPKIERTSPSGRVRWTVRGHIAIDGSADWQGDHDVDVVA
ncbi:MAG: hypothetical protein HOV80_01190 [Polyangiaceae bacterium]|nr:hypothetical protein [Polyangiaceae bacterium]